MEGTIGINFPLPEILIFDILSLNSTSRKLK